MAQVEAPTSQVFSVGHSSHSLDAFLRLLTGNRVEVLVDVRSQPYSRFSPHFNRESLELAVRRAGIKYLFLGEELGGRPTGDEFYDDQGHVLYGRVAQSPLFLEGIKRLEDGISRYRIALMCSEEDPAGCHRHLLVGRVLADRGVTVHHIRGDGRVEMPTQLAATPAAQFRLFTPNADDWRSVAPVPRRNGRNASRLHDRIHPENGV